MIVLIDLCFFRNRRMLLLKIHIYAIVPQQNDSHEDCYESFSFLFSFLFLGGLHSIKNKYKEYQNY